MDARERAAVEERLRAYIRPNVPQDEAQEAALGRAVDAQAAWDAQRGGDGLPPGAVAATIGSYSVTLAEPQGAAYTRESICPEAWAILTNAGLLRRAWPLAQRL